MEYYDIRHQVLSAIQEAVSLGLIHGTSGNIAVRDPASGTNAITPSGIAYATMKPPCTRRCSGLAPTSTPPYIPTECSAP